MSEESFPIAKEQQEAYIETGIHLVEEYMKEKEYQGLIIRRFIFPCKIHPKKTEIN